MARVSSEPKVPNKPVQPWHTKDLQSAIEEGPSEKEATVYYSSTKEEGVESETDLMPRRKVAASESLIWVDVFLRQFWPKINIAVSKVVKESFELSIRNNLPLAFRSLCLEKFSFGDKHMQIQRVEVWDAPCLRHEMDRRGVELHLRISMDADIDIRMRIGPIEAGVRGLSLKGTLVLRLEPLLDTPPIVGGIACYFVDPPTIDLAFSGVAQVADSALLASRVRSTVDSLVATALVLPNVQAVSLADNEDEVDTAALKDPKPQGVLRVTACMAQNLYGHDWNLFGKATSDPYLRLMLGADEWESSVVYKTCNPVWTSDNTHDFLVYDRVQQLRIDVHDWGPSWALNSGDVIGRAQPLRVHQLLEMSMKGIPLYHPKANFEDEPGPQCGDLFLEFSWLRLTPGHLQSDGCVVRVKIDEVHLPCDLEETAGAVQIEVAGLQQCSPVVAAEELPPARGKRVQAQSSPRRQQRTRRTVELPIEHTMSFALDAATAKAALESGEVEIQVLNANRVLLASGAVPLADLAREQHHKRVWARRNPMQLACGDGEPIRVEVQVSLVGTLTMGHPEACEMMQAYGKACEAMIWNSHHHNQGGLKRRSSHRNVTLTSAATVSRCRTFCYDTSESLDWANGIFDRIWPKLVKYLERTIEDPYGAVNLKLRASLPKVFQSLCFSRFNLGSNPPVFGLIKICEAPERQGQESMRGLELHLRMSLDSDADVLLTALHMTFGIHKLRIEGEVLIRLEPLLEELPVCGGVVVCFLDAPRVEMEFVKLARIVDNFLIAGTVKNLINSAIAGVLVMPNVWGMRFGTEDQGVDSALLRTPKPLGVLRVTVLRAEDLPAAPGRSNRSRSCSSSVYKATSTCVRACFPYSVKLWLADDEWSSQVFARSRSPTWPEGQFHDFLFFDWRQTLGVEVLEGKSLQANAVIARMDVFTVLQAVQLGRHGTHGLKLVKARSKIQEQQSGDDGPAGQLFLKCEWLVWKPGQKGTDRHCVVRVKADEAFVPPTVIEEGVMLRARIGAVERSTPEAMYVPDADRDEDNMRPDNDLAEFEIEFILYLLVEVAALESGVLEIQLLTKKSALIGRANVPMRDILRAPDLSRDWGYEEDNNLELSGPGGMKSEAMVSVSIRGLGRAHENLLKDPQRYSPPE